MNMYRVTINTGRATTERVIVRARSHEEAERVALEVTKTPDFLVEWITVEPL